MIFCEWTLFWIIRLEFT